MKLNQPGQIRVWIWLCPDCGRAGMAPLITQDCEVHCPLCWSEDIVPHNILVWMAGQPRGLESIVNFLRYGRARDRMSR